MEKIIMEYKDIQDLNKKIVLLYIESPKVIIESISKLLTNKNWANSDSEYHVNLRLKYSKKVIEAKRQIKLLSDEPKS